MNESTEMVPTGQNGMVVRHGFGETQIEKRAETSATAVAAQAQAAIEARYKMALGRPRRMDNVRLSLLAECKRPGFAEVARYAKPLGKKLNKETGKWEKQFARGFSVRFAESAARCMGNLLITSTVSYDDEKTRIIHVTVSDLESNVTSETDVMIEKTVERKEPKGGQVIVRQRINSYGDPVYIVEASDDELLVKSAAMLSKARRNLILQMIPGDIQEDAQAMVEATLDDPKAVDPAAARKKLIDAFANLNVMPDDIEAYLEHPIEKCTPGQLGMLRELWVSLNENDTTWKAIMEGKEVVDAKPADAPDAAPPKTTADLKAREKKQKAAAPPVAAPVEPPAASDHAEDCAKKQDDRYACDCGVVEPPIS